MSDLSMITFFLLNTRLTVQLIEAVTKKISKDVQVKT